MKRLVAVLSVGCLVSALASVPGVAQAPGLTMLDTLERGAWELRVREDGVSSQRMCVNNARQFIQLRHAALKCRSVIVEDSAGQVTVQYTCPGQGYGRTTVRRESDRLAQIDSQGIADGVPFAFAAEARRVGECQK